MTKTELLHTFKFPCVYVLRCVSKKCVHLSQTEALSDALWLLASLNIATTIIW